MAERLVAPGVFTRENDKSYLPQGVNEIGAAVIGPTAKGPALVPTEINSYSDFEMKFGSADGTSYVPYTVREYIQHAGTMTVTRILGLGGYSTTIGVLVATHSISGTVTSSVVAAFHETTANLGSLGVTASIDTETSYIDFDLTLGSITSSVYDSLSIRSTDANWYGKALGTKPLSTTDSAYLYLNFKNVADEYVSDVIAESATGLVTSSNITLTLTTDYSIAETPWVQSQPIANTSYNLLKFKTLSHGHSANSEIKVGITSIKYASENPGVDYGTFAVVVRRVGDNDRAPVVLETYNNLSLDRDSANYICKKIGTKVPVYNSTANKIIWSGDYDNMSNYIVVEVHTNVEKKSYSAELLPHGFAAVQQPFAVSGYNMPTASMVSYQQFNDLWNDKIYLGFNYDFDNTDNVNYLSPITSNSTTGSNQAFNLWTDGVWEAGAHPMSASIAQRKFMLPFQGGFDGRNPATPPYMGVDMVNGTNVMGYDLSTSTASGSVAYNRAMDMLSDSDVYDINLLLTPGVTNDLAPHIITKGIDLCESRGDSFYIFDGDILETTNLTTVLSTIESIDTNYAATYYPWVKYLDVDRNKLLWVPPSVVVAGVFAYNDEVGYEWWAPAGLNRGGVNAKDVYYPLSQPNRETLYDGKVNPIASFPHEGIVVWGQKTLQTAASALDRVNVRRLLINLKKFIASSTKYLVFEQNTSATRNKFMNIVNPYMETVQQRSGLYAFKVVMDETNNTPDVIDRNEMFGEIWIQPTRTAEFIVIDFNIMPTGATFGA